MSRTGVFDVRTRRDNLGSSGEIWAMSLDVGMVYPFCGNAGVWLNNGSWVWDCPPPINDCNKSNFLPDWSSWELFRTCWIVRPASCLPANWIPSNNASISLALSKCPLPWLESTPADGSDGCIGDPVAGNELCGSLQRYYLFWKRQSDLSIVPRSHNSISGWLTWETPM